MKPTCPCCASGEVAADDDLPLQLMHVTDGKPLSTRARNRLRSQPRNARYPHVILVAYDATRLARLLQFVGRDGNRRHHQPEQPKKP